jgi:hypothetical protein
MSLRIVTVVLAVCALLGRPIAAQAYEIDVHFYLTYVLARVAGLGDPQAWLMARADQSQDDNGTTTAFRFPLPPLHYRRQGKLWHAFNSDQHSVMARFLDLQCRAGVTRAFDRGVESVCVTSAASGGPLQLVRLGQFLHFYEDTYAHSRSSELTAAWVPYRPTFGHLFEGIQPDLIPNRPALARLMAWEVFCTLKTFAIEHGDVLAAYPNREQIDSLVDAVSSAYRDDHGNRALQGAAGDARGIPTASRLNHYRPANLVEVRCELSAQLRRSMLLLDEPDVSKVGYTMLAFDAAGNPKPSPPELQPSRYEPVSCAELH